MNISEKISLYDFLTMMVTGFVILFMLIPWNCIEKYWVLITVFSYIVGLFYHRFLECLGAIIEVRKPSMSFFLVTVFIRNYDKALEKMRNEQTKLEEIKKEYYSAYYYIMDKPCYKNIGVLETQVAFARNASWLLLALGIGAFSNADWDFLEIAANWKIGVFFVVLFAISFFVRYFTQLKIYKLVWEGANYTKPMEKEEIVNQNYGLFVCNNNN